MWIVILVAVIFFVGAKKFQRVKKDKVIENISIENEDEEIASPDIMGAPYILTKPPENFLGEGNPNPQDDPLSIYYDSR